MDKTRNYTKLQQPITKHYKSKTAGQLCLDFLLKMNVTKINIPCKYRHGAKYNKKIMDNTLYYTKLEQSITLGKHITEFHKQLWLLNTSKCCYTISLGPLGEEQYLVAAPCPVCNDAVHRLNFHTSVVVWILIR